MLVSILTPFNLKVLITATTDIFLYIFCYFQEKIRLAISCESSASHEMASLISSEKIADDPHEIQSLIFSEKL